MNNPPVTEQISHLIRNFRDQPVILGTDLAAIYAVETRVLNQAVKRNQDRFPDDFVIKLTRDEILSISQSVTSLARLRFSKQSSHRKSYIVNFHGRQQRMPRAALIG